MADPHPVEDVASVLWEEFRALNPGAPAAGTSLSELYAAVAALPEPRSALCLSGGGIRSASFALGVVQALARHGLLGRFEYLSTVSGGGYLGGFLSAWRKHANDDAAVISKLSQRTVEPPEEAAELRALRANSNFLTPKVGLMSADTWTGIALYVRNLLLNWLILGPLLFAVVAVPIAASELVEWARYWPSWVRYVLLAAASLSLFLGLATSVAYRTAERKPGLARRAYLIRVLLPLVLGASLLVLYAVQRGSEVDVAYGAEHAGAYYGMWALWGAVLYALAWFAAKIANRAGRKQTLNFARTLADPAPEGWLLVAWTLVGALMGAILAHGLALWVPVSGGMAILGFELDSAQAADQLVVVGTGWVMLSMQLAELLYVGLASYARNGEMEREWLARSAGWMTAAAIGWGVLAFVALVGPFILTQFSGPTVSGVGGVSGIGAALAGASGRIPVKGDSKVLKYLSTVQLVSLAALVFLICLAIVASWVLRALLREIALNWDIGVVLASVLMFAALMATAWISSYFININRFSAHAIYRNRLIRGFLGAARVSVAGEGARRPDPFTDFDPNDNIPLKDLLGVGKRGLFHVVNMALNVVATANLAWQERKAESFCATPLAVGNPHVGYRPTRWYGGGGWGLSAGTAVAISGAAASPNMGYHSSPLVGLLMMLFNVRLGWWLGNPNNDVTYTGEGPIVGISPIVRELFGLTNDTSPYVYLSDGGHFENLGIYEMVRRRCRFIVVSDASADPNCDFTDLGDAMRKIWIDLGVHIVFDKLEIKCRSSGGAPAAHAALGTIVYPEAGALGTIVYVKPSLYGNEPPDIRAYAAAHPAFPHESTGDQWFTESQMESYRSLGSYIVEELCQCGVAHMLEKVAPQDIEPLTFDQFIDRASAHIVRRGGP